MKRFKDLFRLLGSESDPRVAEEDFHAAAPRLGADQPMASGTTKPAAVDLAGILKDGAITVIPGYHDDRQGADRGENAFFRWTMLGRQMRACSANRDAARLCGIHAGNMVTLSFVLSAAIGAIGGAVVCPITYIQYDSGTPLAIKGFTVAILGGLGNSMAAVGAGMILGVLESFSIWILPTAYKEAISISILLAILFVRPSGIFGSAEAARLKEF